ncbi:MAG: aminotransferase class I/II-fold pyridoxal phosphate-dependent enzyme [Gemmatimonadaceae bacterium]
MKLRPEVTGVTESPLLLVGTLAESIPGTIRLCYGESDLPTPEFIVRAANDAMAAGHTYYTHTAGYPELREAIAAKTRELHGVECRGSEIMSTVGATMALYAAIRACVGPGDNAIVLAPAYSSFVNAIIICGAEPREVPLAVDGDRFRLDLDRIERAIDANTRMLIVNSPHNPTGCVFTTEEQHALLGLADRHDLVILSDEVYERIVYDMPLAPSFAVAAAEDSLRDRLIVANSFSKAYNMTGWRLGWAQSTEATIKTMYKAVEFMTSNASSMVQQAGIVALRDGEPFIAALRASYAARREQALAALADVPGVSIVYPEGAFYAFLKVDGLTDSISFTERLVREGGLALTPGLAFGKHGEGYVRLCFASSEAVIADGIQRLTRFMSTYVQS